MEQNGTALTETDISDANRVAIEEILSRHLMGQESLSKVIDEVGSISRTTFYRIRKQYPDDFEEIRRGVLRSVLSRRSDSRLAHDAYKETLTYDLEHHVGDHARSIVDQLLLIVNGKPYEVEVLVNRRNDDGEWELVYEPKSIVPYPRDIIAAANSLYAFLKEGVLPESSHVAAASPVEVTEEQSGLMPIFGGNTAFSKIEATRPDGTRFSINVGQDDIIEVDEDEDSRLP